MSTVAEQQESQPSAVNDADNVTLEGLGAMLKERQAQSETGEVQEQTEPDVSEEPENEVLEENSEGAEESPIEEADDEPDAQDADEGEEAEESEDRTQAAINKRIGKLTSQKKLAEEQRREVETRLSKVEQENSKLQELLDKQGTDRLAASDPLAGVMTQRELTNQTKQFRAMKRWATRNPDGGEYELPDGKTVEYDSDQAEQLLNYAEDMLDEEIPRREQWLADHSKMDGMVSNHFPAWNESSSDQYAQYQDILRQMPELKRFPNYKQLVGVFYKGLEVYNQELTADAPPSKPKPKKVSKSASPTKVTSPSSAPPPANSAGTGKALSQAEQAVADSNGSPDAVLQLLRAKSAARAA
jgi:hypothetical protein